MRFKSIAIAAVLVFPLVALAQSSSPGGRGPGPSMGPRTPFRGGLIKIFGDNKAFTANVLIKSKTQMGELTMPGKMAFLDGQSRFEMDASQMTGGNLPPGSAEQMKAMGMAEMVSISRPDKKENYIVYPGLKAYAVVPGEDATATADAKAELKKTELGKETVEGHPTTKYKVVVKDETGKDQEVTMWSASDLNGFPVRIQVHTDAGPSLLTFSDVKLGKPSETLFTPPSGLKRYNDVTAMMREEMMKKFAPPVGGAIPAPQK